MKYFLLFLAALVSGCGDIEFPDPPPVTDDEVVIEEPDPFALIDTEECKQVYENLDKNTPFHIWRDCVTEHCNTYDLVEERRNCVLAKVRPDEKPVDECATTIQDYINKDIEASTLRRLLGRNSCPELDACLIDENGAVRLDIDLAECAVKESGHIEGEPVLSETNGDKKHVVAPDGDEVTYYQIEKCAGGGLWGARIGKSFPAVCKHPVINAVADNAEDWMQYKRDKLYVTHESQFKVYEEEYTTPFEYDFNEERWEAEQRHYYLQADILYSLEELAYMVYYKVSAWFEDARTT